MATLLQATGSSRLISENYVGTDLSGVTGTVNRTLDVGRTPLFVSDLKDDTGVANALKVFERLPR